ncbi:Centrosomal protein of 76 kDa [Phlyctochytrium planicorne]|nr:Centrosomal protein of 76 kDa [Phlyctochytrium planicorne]
MAEQKKRIVYTMTKQWWNEYLQIRPSHAERLVKILAKDEQGDRRLVCSFLQPLHSRFIESSKHAARIVSLIGVEKKHGIGNTEADVWFNLQTIMNVNKLPAHCHAILLTSLLLGFSLNAYLTLGSSKTVEAAAWVTTISNQGSQVEFWDPIAGTRWLAKDVEAHGYRTIGCMFNHESFYANAASVDLVAGLDFDLRKDWLWKALPTEAVEMSKRREMEMNFPILPFQPAAALTLGGTLQNLDSQSLAVFEEDLEALLRHQIDAFRDDYDLRCFWDDAMGRILAQCLWGCEMGRLLRLGGGGSGPGGMIGSAVHGDIAGLDFQESVRRSIPEGYTFRSCKDLLLTRGDKVRFALRVRVFPYVEKLMACWVMLGVRLRITPNASQ